jgi:pyruvate,water dikinase
MKNNLLLNLVERNLPTTIGRKAANLQVLLKYGMKIPVTYVIPTEVFDSYQSNQDSIFKELHSELTRKLDLSQKYAIRSSANVEDSLYHSFAGQFNTSLNVYGIDDLLDSIKTTWDSTNSSAVMDYAKKLSGQMESLKMAVIVQEMVTPVYSGVVFSKNPITGTDEIVIEAVEGIGEQLVQSGVTPYRWIYKWGKWIVKPDNHIPESVINLVIEGTKKIVKSHKRPVDLEWVFDGSTINWVQLRDITTSHQLNIYSNRISKEMMPGQITPLIWSINLPLIIPTWIGLLNELVGETHLKVNDLAKQFYYRSYFNMGAMGRVFSKAGFPSEGLEMMNGVVPKEAGKPVYKFSPGMMKIAPRIIRFFIEKWNFAKKYRKNMPSLMEEIMKYEISKIPALSLDELIAETKQLFLLVQKIVYSNVHVPLLLTMYNNLLNFYLKKLGVKPENFDFVSDIEGVTQYNPNFYLRDLRNLYQSLPQESRDFIISNRFDPNQKMKSGSKFKEEFLAFIQKFGHLSDNTNNFSSTPWREKPEKILEMISEFPEEEEKEKKLLKYSGLQKKSFLLSLFYKRTCQFFQYREEVGYYYSYGYGLFRPYFLSIAQHFVNMEILDEINDIFYLDWEEIQTIASAKSQTNDYKIKIKQTKEDIEKTRDVDLPTVIFGDQPPPIIPQHSSTLKGVPTSQGYYTGPVRKVQGIDDFSKVKIGDVLVIPFSEVGWTPLFAKARAVVSESGGMLSHSSIIAREYQIPAVVSVNNAMKLIDNQIISIDGYKGEIIVHGE